jgi:aspartyl-tRNA(Asn)/glutamyl-tRNA(Gln) amidotransferase subunit B
MFSASSASFGGEPNVNIDPVTLGLPGSLPVANRLAIEFGIMLGLATNCKIRNFNRFARKHYFYPDLPKGYQISQFDEPLCEWGNVIIDIGGQKRTIGLERIHLEEDAGKNIHEAKLGASLIDLNRAGVPLLEVVSKPDLRSPEEAGAFLKALRQIVRFLGISDGNMEEGSLRCDANISLRPLGCTELGTRAEIKNINSFRFVEKALEYEIARQSSIIRSGERVVQETRLFDTSSGTTKTMRSKEESAEYRYFPDPDLPPVVVDSQWIEEIRSKMPKLPDQCRDELIGELGLSSYDADVLCAEPANLAYFREVLSECNNPKLSSNWITSELFAVLNKESISIEESPISAKYLGELLTLITKDILSGKMAKAVFEEVLSTGRSPSSIVKEKGLRQITGEDEISVIIEEVLSKHSGHVVDYLNGQERLFGFFVGQTMKATGGNADPKKVNEILKKALLARKV